MKTTEELFDLRGKVALVTGGSRGIGRAVSEGLASAGADVVIASRKLNNCDAAAREIESATGRRAVPFECHVGRWQDCDRLVESVYREFGTLRRAREQRGDVSGLREPDFGHRGSV